MDATADRLRASLEEWTPRLAAFTDERAARRTPAGGWSPKELVGHLIDSASVNLERILRAQETDHLELPGYPQDAWVVHGRYADAPWEDLVTLWSLLNRQVARVIEGVPADVRDQLRTRHRLDLIAFRTVPRDRPTTLGYLMDDYVEHLDHHLQSLAS